MSPQVPTTMKAFVAGEKLGTATLAEVPVPQIGDNEILIQIKHSSQNPTDWKHEQFFSPKGALIGCDFSGVVAKVGPNLAQPHKVGDKVAGWVHGGLFPDKGAYAEYCKQDSDLVWKVEEGISLKTAPHYGIPWTTVGHAMIHDQKHAFPPQKVEGNPWYLVYGASSSVGLYAVQLAKALGYRVVGVCSQRNADLVKSYGADEIVDYRDVEKAKSELQRITGGGVTYGMDTISEGSSFEIALAGFKAGAKGKLNAVLPVSEEVKKINPDIEVEWTLAYTLMGKGFTSPFTNEYLPANKEERAFLVELYKRTPEYISKYNIRPNPVHELGGLETVREGLELQKANKISGKKITYTYA